MARRYLLRNEVEGALRRGKTVECFLGGFEDAGRPGMRHISLDMDGAAVIARLYESADLGDPALLDIYEFGPLSPSLDLGEADQKLVFLSLDSCLDYMEQSWPGSSSRLVNEGVLQDEYADFVAGRSS